MPSLSLGQSCCTSKGPTPRPSKGPPFPLRGTPLRVKLLREPPAEFWLKRMRADLPMSSAFCHRLPFPSRLMPIPFLRSHPIPGLQPGLSRTWAVPACATSEVRFETPEDNTTTSLSWLQYVEPFPEARHRVKCFNYHLITSCHQPVRTVLSLRSLYR